MVRHIVMYRLKDENKEENARQMKEKLEGLNGKIDAAHSETLMSSGGRR